MSQPSHGQPASSSPTHPGNPESKPVDVSAGRSFLWFSATILLGAFLVFQVQPIISKCVLPWFGGTPAVWTTCMLFFQLLLFAGYLYAHFLKTYCKPFVQGVIHIVLLAAAALLLPIEPSDAWKPTGSEPPTLYLLWMLAAHVGLPYFVLSSTGPLVQSWLSLQDDNERVYRLYALSNAGSLFALLSYPFLFEPVLSVSTQSMLWSLMFCLFVLVQGYVAVALFRMPAPSQQHSSGRPGSRSSVSIARQASWIALPALASVLLLVVTNHVCQDIAVVPFLWVLPLSLYLLSFIVCFDSPHWYRPKPIAAMTLVALAMIQAKSLLPAGIQLIAEASCYMLMLFGACLLCHGEVARLKPATDRLTQFYAMLSGGGALGGIIVAVLCPMLLNNHAELPFFVSLITAMAFLTFFAATNWTTADYDWSAAYRLKYGAILLMIVPLLLTTFLPRNRSIASQRNFFGVLEVREKPLGITLVHGQTLHGMQRFAPHQAEPTTYYGRESGAGRVIKHLQQQHDSLSIGIVGLGCGVLTTYGRPDDHFDAIEINPDVIDLADRYFTFMRDCPAPIDRHLGDGRLVLERLTDKRFDVLILDAFSSDAIPVHLLTRESMLLYKKRLVAGGVLAIHISNNHLELAPLVHNLARDADLESRLLVSAGDPALGTKRASWMIIADKGNEIFAADSLREARAATDRELEYAPLWTDQRHNLVSVLRLWQ